MIHLVERHESPVAQETGIASVARAALGADSVLIVELTAGMPDDVIDSSGLSPEEVDLLLEALGRRRRPQEVALQTGFHRVLIEELSVPGVGGASLCAALRGPGALRHVGLAGALVRHGVTAAAMQRADARFRDPGGYVGALGFDEELADFAQLDQRVTDVVVAVLGARAAGLLLWDEAESCLRPVPGAFRSDPCRGLPPHAAHDWASSAARVFATGDPYLSNDADADEGILPDYVEEFAIEQLLAVPVELARGRVGVLQVINKPGGFSVRDVRLAEALGPRIAVWARAVIARDQLERTRSLERTLGEMAIAIASGRDLPEFLATVLDAVCDALSGSVIALVPAAGDAVIRRVRDDAGRLEQTFLAESKATVAMSVYGIGPRRAGQLGWSVAHVPVLLDGRSAATLSALRLGGAMFDSDECRALSRLAHLVALAWSAERYQRGLADTARVAERQRIADELHDQVAQLLFASRISLDFALEVRSVPSTAIANIERARDLLVRADAATRLIMEHNSQSAEDRLCDRLAAIVGSVEEEFARPVALEITAAATEAAAQMSGVALQLLSRAAREALVNAAKHAGPCQLAVRVAVTRRNRLLLTVTDGGIGVSATRSDGYGTSALRRAVRRQGGVLRVDAPSSGGTRVNVSLPL